METHKEVLVNSKPSALSDDGSSLASIAEPPVEAYTDSQTLAVQQIDLPSDNDTSKREVKEQAMIESNDSEISRNDVPVDHVVDLTNKSTSHKSSENNEEDVDFGMDNYFFSQDFLPERYDRNSQSDVPLRFVSSIQITVNVILLTGFTYISVQKVKSMSVPHTADIVLLTLFYASILFWFNYKLHSLLMSVSRLFMNLEVIKRNDKYYSGVEIPDFFIHSREYPPVTIQIPVDAESDDRYLKPTLLCCVSEADRYTNETGAKCNILICDDGLNFLSDEERLARISFYTEHHIGFIARPHPDKLPRSEINSTAANLNFAMNFTTRYLVAPDSTLTSTTPTSKPVSISTNLDSTIVSKEQHEAYQAHRNHLISLGTFFYGDIDTGELILLLSVDSRLSELPRDENGCIKRLVKEMLFDGEEVLYLQCFTAPYLSIKLDAEKSIFHHTCNLYNSLIIGTAVRMLAPLLGHNVLLSKKALSQCAQPCPSGDSNLSGFKQYWREDLYFKDFDLMMRAYNRGFVGRLVSYAGAFQNSISQSYLGEYLKTGGYAAGAAEMLYNPIYEWYRKGVLSPSIIDLFKSKTIEWYNKVLVVSFSFIFLTISGIHWAILHNLIFCNLIVQNIPYPLLPVNLMWGSIFLGVIIATAVNFMFGLRLNVDKWMYFKQTVRESVFNTCLYGSISVRMSVACYAHLCGLKMNHAIPPCNLDDKLTLINWIHQTPSETIVYFLHLIAIVIRLLVFTSPEDRSFVGYYGCLPMLWGMFLFWMGPFLFDILPSSGFFVRIRETLNNNQLSINSNVMNTLDPQQAKSDPFPDTTGTELGTDNGSNYSPRDSARSLSASQTNLSIVPEDRNIIQV